MDAPRKSSERRRRDLPVVRERRAKSERRNQCPQCGSFLFSDEAREQGFRRLTRICTSSHCDFTETHRIVPMSGLALDSEYAISLETLGKDLAFRIPLELCHFAKLQKGGKGLLKVLGNRRWSLEFS